jgi:hypothetical protein
LRDPDVTFPQYDNNKAEGDVVGDGLPRPAYAPTLGRKSLAQAIRASRKEGEQRGEERESEQRVEKKAVEAQAPKLSTYLPTDCTVM